MPTLVYGYAALLLISLIAAVLLYKKEKWKKRPLFYYNHYKHLAVCSVHDFETIKKKSTGGSPVVVPDTVFFIYNEVPKRKYEACWEKALGCFFLEDSNEYWIIDRNRQTRRLLTHACQNKKVFVPFFSSGVIDFEKQSDLFNGTRRFKNIQDFVTLKTQEAFSQDWKLRFVHSTYITIILKVLLWLPMCIATGITVTFMQ